MKIYNLSILFSFFGLWITSMFSGEIEIILGFILIFSFGILHGSNDILLINFISNTKTKYPFFRVLFTYILTVLSAVIIFYFLPLVGLTLFILFSAYHFGEQHWENKTLDISKALRPMFFFIYGLLLLQLLFVLNSNDVIEVIYSITKQIISEDLIIYSFILNTVIFTLLTLYLYLKSDLLKKIILTELAYLLIFTIIFKVSTLIWGFTIYFIFWQVWEVLFNF